MNACVYTCLMGGYEKLNALKSVNSRRIPHFCFTDDPDLKSDSWQIRMVRSAFSMDRVRSQRRIKVLAHEYLPEFSCSLYIDNTVRLTASADTLIQRFLEQTDIAVPTHSFRASVYDEFVEVAESGLDEPARIFEQLNHYQLSDPEILSERPFWSGMLFRRHCKPEVQAVMVKWYEHIARYARRDQLSLNATLRGSRATVQRLEIDNFQSDFHEWPIFNQRNLAKRFKDVSMAGAPTSVRLTQLERELAQANHAIQTQQHVIGERDRQIKTLMQRIDQLLNSRSFRVTRPLRWLRSCLPSFGQ
ncbi:glycosyltransferase domain-containing protein [Candidatus Glomeribacter gigasporarum]|nr:glycosyltransferase domain-containing protein [Candidatus Glomeribacter gigasporarum]